MTWARSAFFGGAAAAGQDLPARSQKKSVRQLPEGNMADEKRELMQRVQAALDALSDRVHAQHSYLVAQKLMRQPEFRRAKTVAIFVGYGGEVDTISLIEAALQLGKRVAAPTTDRERRRLVWREVTDPDAQIDLGPLGLPQPLPACREADPTQFELVTVPGLVWDERGRRLTRWSGYFDRFLRLAPRALKVGLAFDLQVVEDLSALTQETVVDVLITDDQVRRFGLAEIRTERRLPGAPHGYKG
jgi:5-formyltetrahydrofolate cyclo-ligase